MLKDLYFEFVPQIDPIIVICINVLIFIFFLILIMFEFKNKTKKKWVIVPSVIILFFCVINSIPLIISDPRDYEDFSAKEDVAKCIRKTKIANNLSYNPWQKSLYYLKLGNLYFYNKDAKSAMLCYDEAYKYIKTYKYPLWLGVGGKYIFFGEYDKAINIFKKFSNTNSELSFCYTMKTDFETAYLYINKISEKDIKYYQLAHKAYLERRLGQEDKSLESLNKAIENLEIAKRKEYFTNSRGYDDRLEKLRQYYNGMIFKQRAEHAVKMRKLYGLD